LTEFVTALSNLNDSSIKIQVGRHALQALATRVVSFEEQDAALREIVAESYQAEEAYLDAAKVLQGIQLESSQRKVSDADKIKLWIRICRLYLEEDDTLGAESFLNRAKNLIYRVSDREIELHFQLSQARILDSRRKFLDASQAYHGVSLASSLADEERNMILSKAIICAVLAPAGPQRSRLLGKLYKDARASNLEELAILEKMFLDRLISPVEVSNFADNLAPHQLAKTSDGSTVLSKAVVEHNLLATSKLYSNIATAELAILLGLGLDSAEQYAARMIEQGRLTGQIDQIDEWIHFMDDGQTLSSDKAGPAPGIRKWDQLVQGVIEEVERVSSLIQSTA